MRLSHLVIVLKETTGLTQGERQNAAMQAHRQHRITRIDGIYRICNSNVIDNLAVDTRIQAARQLLKERSVRACTTFIQSVLESKPDTSPASG
ncbi:hypothetical protein D3C76_1680960 [compost metagenome]